MADGLAVGDQFVDVGSPLIAREMASFVAS